MGRFRAHSKHVQREAGLAHMIESARIREIQFSTQALQLRNEKVDRRYRALSSLPAIDYLSKQAKLSRLKHPGTCVWFERTSEYLSWLGKLDSSCLCCYGIPGSGKSILTASLRDTLLDRISGQSDTVLCYYYCDHADAASLEPERILASFTKQVLETLPWSQFDNDFICPYMDERSKPSLSQSSQYLTSLLGNFKTAYIVLDGLDELSQDNQTFVLKLLDTLLQLTTTVIKLCVTSRTEEFRVRKALHSHITIRLTELSVAYDIALFINDEITHVDASHPLSHDADLKQEVIAALVVGAKGM
jgi:Cdc6-like AAA superfamily ATPase